MLNTPFILTIFFFFKKILQSPNLVGCPLGILQLVLYCKYRKKGIIEEPMKWDPEKNDDKTKQLQPVNDDNTINGKL